MRLEGVFHVTQPLSDKFAFLMLYRKVRFGSKEISRPIEFPIHQPCMFLTKKTIFGDPVGDSFTPRLTCPPKQETYKFNLTVSLKQIADIPDLRTKYLIDFNGVDPTKTKAVFCVKLVVWIRF